MAKSVPQSDIFGPQDEIVVGIKKFMKGFSESQLTAFGTFANNRYRRINLEKRFPSPLLFWLLFLFLFA